MSEIQDRARAARQASFQLASVSTDIKNKVLSDLADALETNHDAIMAANSADMDAARAANLSGPKLKRLEITESVLAQMADGLRLVAKLPDPIGMITKDYQSDSGLHVQRVRIPIGVIAMIYEARPNVTIDAFGLCFKAGNACFLKGGKEAHHSNQILAELAREVLKQNNLSTAAIDVMTGQSRDEIRELLTLDQYIDLVIPRGGTELIRFVHENSRIPMVQHFHGVCHIYVDEFADAQKAYEICVTAKTSAPATCNATECILIHEKRAEEIVPNLAAKFKEANVEVRGDENTCKLAPTAIAASPEDWGREFLDYIVAIKIVPDIDAAIDHIQTYGSNHTDAIVSENEESQTRFLSGVSSSCVLTNASTRFNDGYQLGLGAEIGISTSKVHAYGPMGLEELTTQRFVVRGTGQTR